MPSGGTYDDLIREVLAQKGMEQDPNYGSQKTPSGTAYVFNRKLTDSQTRRKINDVIDADQGVNQPKKKK